jgi:hypothetical protein
MLDHKGICGFLGLIPLCIGRLGERQQSYWACDWSRDRNAPKGSGRFLLEQASKFCIHHMGFGGNEISQNLYPKYASLTVPAGRVYRRTIRFGFHLDRIKKRVPWFPFDQWKTIRDFPVIPGAVRRAHMYAKTVEGIGRELESVLEPRASIGIRPLYDHEYIHWQIGRCPFLESATCFSPNDTIPRAAAAVWCQKSDRTIWKMAIWSEHGAIEELGHAIDAAIKHIYDLGGQSVSIIVSRLDTEFHDVLESRGFYTKPPNLKLYILASEAATHPVEELEHLSYLDTDLAYRF